MHRQRRPNERRKYRDYAKRHLGDGEVGTFKYPEIEDGLYIVQIMDVGDVSTRPKYMKPDETETEFFLQLEFIEDIFPEDTNLRYYIRIPDGWLANRTLSKKSNLYGTMEALGLITEGEGIRVRPSEWQGMQCRALVENHVKDDGTNVPRVEKLMPMPVKARPARIPREAVAAGDVPELT